MEKIHAVIFDVDGVLVDTVPLHFAAWRDSFQAHGFVFGAEHYLRLNGIPREQGVRLVLDMYGVSDEQLVSTIAAEKQNLFLSYLEKQPLLPIEGAVDFIKFLSEKKIIVSAASSSKNARYTLTKAGIIGMFQDVVTGEDFIRAKPDPDIFLTASSRIAVLPHEAIVVEDAAQGITAAVRGGFKTLGLAASEKREALMVAGAEVVVDHFSEARNCIFFSNI